MSHLRLHKHEERTACSLCKLPQAMQCWLLYRICGATAYTSMQWRELEWNGT